MRFTILLYSSSKGTITGKLGELTKRYANLPESFIQRTAENVEFKTPNRRQYLPRKREQPVYRFTANRPWTDEWKRQNDRVRPPVLIEPIKDWCFYRGDRVEILVGRDRGKHGIISQIVQERNWVFVSGLNAHYRRVGSKEEGAAGVYVKSEAPLLVTSQVALVDPSDNKTTKVEWRFTEDGERVRVSLRTGRIIPMPPSSVETWDYKTPETYLEGDKDTKADVVKAVDFRPTLKTFEMEIMDSMGIVEDRVPKKSYWY